MTLFIEIPRIVSDLASCQRQFVGVESGGVNRLRLCLPEVFVRI